MKNDIKRAIWIVFCVLTASLFFTSAPMVGQAEKSVLVPKLEHYEDKAIGFSLDYDADKLTKEMGDFGSFVFRRASAEGMPSLGITAGPYPSGTTLKDTAGRVSSALPKMIPDCLIHNVINQQLIELKDGSKANYFEIIMNVGGSELISAFVTAHKNDRLIVFGAADNHDESMENLTAMVKSLRLDVEVDESAMMARGFTKDGKFVRTNSPAFTLNYPKSFQSKVLESYQIFRAGIPQGVPSMAISISRLQIGEDIKTQLKRLAGAYADGMKLVGSNIKIISQNPITTYKEFDAYQIQFRWRFEGKAPLTTVVHIIAKENKAIQLAGHTSYDIEKLTDIFHTINLNP
ncbi:MAG: hypothetical protein GY799_00925 [Desulfobulbaceae bacterium]|nr:hypothetical protein [Desulfobulbaceae bacterium]